MAEAVLGKKLIKRLKFTSAKSRTLKEGNKKTVNDSADKNRGKREFDRRSKPALSDKRTKRGYADRNVDEEIPSRDIARVPRKRTMNDSADKKPRKREFDGKSKSAAYDIRKRRVYADRNVDEEIQSRDIERAPRRRTMNYSADKKPQKREFDGKSKLALSNIREKRVYADQNVDEEILSRDIARAPRKKTMNDSADKKPRKREFDGKSKTAVYDVRKTRVYADGDVDEEIRSKDIARSPKKRVMPKGQIKDDFVEVEGFDESPRSMWTSNKKRASSSLKNAADTVQGSSDILKRKPSKQKRSTINQNSDKQRDQIRSKVQDGSSLRTSKKTDKKVLANDVEGPEDHPKKKKRVMRLDPYDISNKRLDDGNLLDESLKEKTKDPERSTGMSKNAQFRAIQPSPSILSFVEENFLGRRRLIELRRAGYNIDLSAPLDNIPFSTSTDREHIEENVFRNKLTFFAAAKASSSFPHADFPEIAFAGRSNVGKSSLLNALTRQWGVVRTSDKPGLTQTINFFDLGPKLRLVDLPGYGFAYAKDEVKDAWEELVKEYVSSRVGLKRVCLLIDTKWGMKPRDNELINLMEKSQTKYQIVLTKTDAVFPIDVARRASQIEESLKANKSAVQPVMMVSSKSGAGVRTLRTVLAKIARFAKV